MIPPAVVGITGFIGAGKTSVQSLLAYTWMYAPYCKKCRLVQFKQIPNLINGKPPVAVTPGFCWKCGQLCLDNLRSLGMRCWSNTPMMIADGVHDQIAEWVKDVVLKEASDIRFGILIIDEQQAATNRSRGMSTRNILWVNSLEQIRKRNLMPIYSANTEGFRVPWEQVMATQIAMHIDAPPEAEGRYGKLRIWDRYGRHMGTSTNKPYILIPPERGPDKTYNLSDMEQFWPLFDSFHVIKPAVQYDLEVKAAKEARKGTPLITVPAGSGDTIDGAQLDAVQAAIVMQVNRIFKTIPPTGYPYRSVISKFRNLPGGADLLHGEMDRRGYEVRMYQSEKWVFPK